MSRDVWSAIIINLALLLLFGLQHSIMARRSFKRWWTRIISPAAERSTYVLLSGILLVFICYFWQPLPGVLWHIENPVGRALVFAIQGVGWLMVIVASFLINHFELFGLQQVYFHYIGKTEPQSVFTERFLYKFVRHPLQSGILIGVWASPTMTATHCMLSAGLSIYVMVGLFFEEKSLVDEFGDQYREYQRRVAMLIPGLRVPYRT